MYLGCSKARKVWAGASSIQHRFRTFFFFFLFLFSFYWCFFLFGVDLVLADDTWHMTCDRWHMTIDTCHMTSGTGQLTPNMLFFLLPRQQQKRSLKSFNFDLSCCSPTIQQHDKAASAWPDLPRASRTIFSSELFTPRCLRIRFWTLKHSTLHCIAHCTHLCFKKGKTLAKKALAESLKDSMEEWQ